MWPDLSILFMTLCWYCSQGVLFSHLKVVWSHLGESFRVIWDCFTSFKWCWKPSVNNCRTILNFYALCLFRQRSLLWFGCGSAWICQTGFSVNLFLPHVNCSMGVKQESCSPDLNTITTLETATAPACHLISNLFLLFGAARDSFPFTSFTCFSVSRSSSLHPFLPPLRPPAGLLADRWLL